jgi:DNA-binding NarL/FixJ family response regulator
MRLAEALVTRTGDREAARDALRSVRATCERLGARPLGTGAEWLARRARLIDTGGRPLPPPGVGGAYLPGETQARALGLSEREVEVLGLLAEGLSDREIGERLFITTKTAGHHVSHILTKLTVERRGEAAAVAFRMGLTGHLA